MTLNVPVLLAALLSGLVGGVHCAAMCGGIATGFSINSPSRGWGNALQLNLGRVGGYILAGAIVGGLGSGLLQYARTPYLALILRMGVGLILIFVALRLWDQRGRMAFLARPAAKLWQWLQPLHQRLLPANTLWKRLAAGMLWGWLPCGLSTTLLATAWLQANARDGALTMAAFGLGTLPLMVSLTWSGAHVGRWLQRPKFRSIAAGLVLSAGVFTMASPWLMQIPMLHGPLKALGCEPPPWV